MKAVDPLPSTSDNPLPLATINARGKPPRQRLANAALAQDIYWRLHDSNRERLARSAVIQGLFDGNPPYNPSKMRSAGQAWRPNFNTLEGASRLEAAKVPYYDLFSSTPLYADCQTDVSTDEVDASTASRVRSKAFDTMLRSYDDLDDDFWTSLNDFIAFNKCFLWFPRPDSWHFERLPWHKVLFPDGTPTKPGKWELFVIRHEWPVHKLYGYVKDEDAASRAGWNVEQVWRAIQQAAPVDVGQAYRDPMDLQKAVRDCDLYMTSRLGTVQAASIYTREFDGSWSRMMVQTQRGTERQAGTPQSRVERDRGNRGVTDTGIEGVDASVKPDDWLYNKREVAKSLYEIMVPFIFEVGDGSVNEVSGFGKKIISVSQAADRLANEMVGSAMMQSSIVLQAQTGAAQAKTSIIQFGGPFTTIPSGWAVQNGTIFGNLEAPLAVSTDLRNRLDTNTGTYRPSFEKPRGNPESATGAQIRFTQGSVLSNSAVQRYYKQLDRLWHEVYRRASMSLPKSSSDPAIKAALDFQKECRDAGLSQKQIEDLKPGSVRAERSIGNGSPMMRQQMMAALGQIVPYMGPRGINNWKIDYAAAFAGQKGAERYFPKEDLHEEPTVATREAVSENNDMQTGAQVLFLESDDHEVHAKTHLTAAVGAVTSVQQGADPAMPFTFLQLALPHIVQHISKVPRQQVREALEKAYKQVATGAQEVFKAAQAQVEQGGRGQQLSFEQQLAAQEAQHKAQLAEFKSKAMLDLKAQRQNVEMQLTAQKAQQEGQLKDATTAADVQRQTATTVAQIETERVKTEAQIENDRRKAEAQAAAARSKPAGGSK